MKLNGSSDNDKIGRKRLSEIGGQEIINLFDGGRLGVVADVDLLIDDSTGHIEALLIPEQKSLFSLFSSNDYIEVPWDAIRKIGQDTLIVEMEDKDNRKKIGI
jgi:YlmC/YmxH family sporulation protein